MSTAPRDSRVKRHWGDDDTQTPILHVDMDSFFAEVELAENPALRGRPLIVGGSGNRGVVTSATYEARASGVRAGMPMMRARALCPQAQVVSGSHRVYAAYSRRVMDILAQVTPCLEQVSIDEAFLDVAGARRRLGSPTSIAAEIRRQIRSKVGLPASVGIACNKSVAKIASAHAKPDGMLLIPAHETIPFLHSLPVGVIWGVGGKTAAVLEREGIITVEALANAPMGRLAKLLGPAVAHHLHDLAWGIDHRSVAARPAEKSVGVERTFEHNISSRSQLERFLLWAAHECARRLRAADMVAFTVAIKLRDGEFKTVSRSVTLSEATDLAAHLAHAAKGLLAQQPIPASGVRLCGLRAENLRSRSQGVPVTLDVDSRLEAAERALDQVKHRFGADVLRPATLMDPASAGPPGGAFAKHSH
ncbi:DNA polymerase IV [Schaalia suimastitidis]|uniref:DNA polymerase IV n=1 Tax=Schaalia suimastitidis TaxID=121163 RepID=UPI000426F10D|nr:DNA polymerase IV [Schaalia suimastitidis]